MLLIKYYSREQIKANEMGWRVARMVDRRGAHTVLVGRPEGKRPFGRPRRSQEVKVKMDKERIMHGHDTHNTTILSIIHNMSTTCFGQ